MEVPVNKIILASGSPRRKELLSGLGFEFEIRVPDVEENFPKGMAPESVPEYLAEKKAEKIASQIDNGDLVIAADTIVILEGKILGKPLDAEEAKKMLLDLSGKKHAVITGVALVQSGIMSAFSVKTDVWFRPLNEWMIDFYISRFQPFDKAGGYAVQEWIGMTGIEKIEGDYFNVVGLPLQALYQNLQAFNI